MHGREFEIDQGAALRIEAPEGGSPGARSSDVAYEPALLDLYCGDLTALREQIMREARRAQAQALRALADVRALSLKRDG